MSAWSSKRSRMAPAADTSLSSLPHSSMGRLEVIMVERDEKGFIKTAALAGCGEPAAAGTISASRLARFSTVATLVVRLQRSSTRRCDARLNGSARVDSTT